MTAIAPPQPLSSPKQVIPKLTWHKLPDDFILPDDPVDNNLHPLLADALHESIELVGLLLESMLITTNFGICSTVGDKNIVKAPDCGYISEVKPYSEGVIRRSYTPTIEGDLPLIVIEFISEPKGTEYSTNPHYPYGKWYFYEHILQVPLYGIFHPKTGELDLFCLIDGKYEPQIPDKDKRFWIAEMSLFLGTWDGKRSKISTTWLCWWDRSENILLWGKEIIDQERQRSEQERQRVEIAELGLQNEQAKRQRLVDRLKALGVDLDLDED